MGREIESNFNHSASSSQILVANVHTLSSGVDLHMACHKGVMMNYHPSPNRVDQIEKSLGRILAKNPVTWHMIRCNDTYNDVQEMRAVNKWAALISA